MKPYYWFQGASVRELFNRLEAAGPDDARLEVRISDDNKMTFRVLRESVESEASTLDINDSHICPPDC